MAKITRVTQKAFGSTGPSGDFGEFGSLAAGAANYTKDPTIIQDLAAFLTGWAAATIADNRPALEDMNSLFLLAFYQIGYLLQQGIPEYDPATTYYMNSFCQVSGTIYKSLADDNLNHPPATSPAYWGSAFDTSAYMDLITAQTANGLKTFAAGLVIEGRTNDTGCTQTGRLWLRTDL